MNMKHRKSLSTFQGLDHRPQLITRMVRLLLVTFLKIQKIQKFMTAVHPRGEADPEPGGLLMQESEPGLDLSHDPEVIEEWNSRLTNSAKMSWQCSRCG